MKALFAGGLVSLSLLLAAPHAMADEAALALAKQRGCLGCHAVDKTIVGPPWKEVSAHYKKDPEGEKKIVASILAGSSGKWGKVHMRANKGLTNEQAVQLARYILSLQP